MAAQFNRLLCCIYLASFGTLAIAGPVDKVRLDANGTRTVTGAYQTTYRQDDGTQTTVSSPQPPGTEISALVPDDSPAGYQSYPGILAADGSFTIPDVPIGTYFLSVVTGERTSLTQHLSSTLELTQLVAARPDLNYPTTATPVTLNISNLDAWTPGGFYVGDYFGISSTQASVGHRPFQFGSAPPPLKGEFSYNGVMDWNIGPGPNGLPDASRGDVVYFHQAPAVILGDEVTRAVYKRATKYARLSDMTLLDGQRASVNVPLIEAPQTGSVRGDVRYAEFEALLADVNPTATKNSVAIDVYGYPYGAEYPSRWGTAVSIPVLFLLAKNLVNLGPLPNVDYGQLAYGQFLDPWWVETTQWLYFVDVSYTAPGAQSPNTYTAFFATQLVGPPSGPIAPVIGPPRAPLINGVDAFSSQADVGVQPTLSWSPPLLGEPTSYGIAFTRLRNIGGATAFQPIFDARVYNAFSFRVPTNILAAGNTYFAVITSNQAPWDGVDALFLRGLPLHSASCATASFSP